MVAPPDECQEGPKMQENQSIPPKNFDRRGKTSAKFEFKHLPTDRSVTLPDQKPLI